MPTIVLTTLNAKYIHAAFGLRYLLANLGPLRSDAAIVEFDINQKPVDIAEVLLAREPKIIGFGVYIWNVAPTAEVIAAIKRVRPDITIILGGPEVSYEVEGQPIVRLADHVITGEADLKFAEVCRRLLQQNAPRLSAHPRVLRNDEQPPHPPFGHPPPLQGGEGRGEGAARSSAAPEARDHVLPKIIAADLPDFSQLVLPYDLYTDDDIAHRIIYVEASRGCPFTCEFCLSSLDIPVRQVPLPDFLEQLQRLLDRGVKQFKFVDRTFNLNAEVSRSILEFFLARHQPGHFYHFEMIPDRLPASLRSVIAKFPPGALQFEVGVQSFNEEVSARIKRRQNCQRLEENFRFLRRETGVHLHADLIAGLPGETVESFAAGFDRLIALGPQEIQVGILKRLRGTPIVRHDDEWQMRYNPQPPYDILQNKLIDFATMQKLRRFARYWDLVGNSGNFIETTPMIWGSVGQASRLSVPGFSPDNAISPVNPLTSDPPLTGGTPVLRSPFHAFYQFSEWLHGRVGRTDGIALMRLMELVFEFLTRELKLEPRAVAEKMWRDYCRGGRRDKPAFLKPYLADEPLSAPVGQRPTALPKRQARHLA